MSYALVHFPTVDATQIDELRRKHDPQVDLIAPHITIMFPVPDSLGKPRLVSHIVNVLRGCKQFSVSLQGLEQSWDNCLFLVLQEGRAEVIRLHDYLYTGMLAPFLRRDIPYVPHVTLGAFADDTKRCSDALRDSTRLRLKYQCVVDRLHLVRIDNDWSCITREREFLLET
jgi:2'-5' RNA ligase